MQLNFKKGEEITLTQRLDGGWWEGTLDGKTGWFPSNYVKDVEPVAAESAAAGKEAEASPSRRVDYRRQVVSDLLEKEKEFVSELRSAHKRFLSPLHRAELLRESEFRQLVGNLDELVEVHCSMNLELEEECSAKDQQQQQQQRVGRVFLRHGAAVRGAHQTYWGNHPRAVLVLERHRERLDSFMESQGAPAPGLMALTTALSRPLRHLEKYAGVAQEVEQHLEDGHPDRGDTQRSISFYKSVAVSRRLYALRNYFKYPGLFILAQAECAKLRRQKELELEVLTGMIRGWEGDKISTLGDIAHMGSVAVGREHKDQYLVLFPHYLVILSVSQRMSAFIYEVCGTFYREYRDLTGGLTRSIHPKTGPEKKYI